LIRVLTMAHELPSRVVTVFPVATPEGLGPPRFLELSGRRVSLFLALHWTADPSQGVEKSITRFLYRADALTRRPACLLCLFRATIAMSVESRF